MNTGFIICGTISGIWFLIGFILMICYDKQNNDLVINYVLTVLILGFLSEILLKLVLLYFIDLLNKRTKYVYYIIDEIASKIKLHYIFTIPLIITIMMYDIYLDGDKELNLFYLLCTFVSIPFIWTWIMFKLLKLGEIYYRISKNSKSKTFNRLFNSLHKKL